MPPNTSATTRPFQPSAKQYRAAANKKGSSDGISTWRMTRCRGTSNARAMSNSSLGVLRTPSRTLMMTNGTPVSTTVMIGPMSPKPNAKLQNSAQARFGMARIATIQSLKKALTALDSPIAMPMTVPITNAMTIPMPKRCNEIANVSYRLCGATVLRVISSHMNLITCMASATHRPRTARWW